ncbi:hypothetical protein B0F90DRAFT_1404610 [Multifurca ochricompacta]|uniref:Secreted protein n=1 Tax=Multifurca ochricompacta TaxID=376703 RepID=A0AAD4LWM2_9AGAM|nr:hypothetical protein B0F90DRAFT_1404610 [Multifurca ochricompacta]
MLLMQHTCSMLGMALATAEELVLVFPGSGNNTDLESTQANSLPLFYLFLSPSFLAVGISPIASCARGRPSSRSGSTLKTLFAIDQE